MLDWNVERLMLKMTKCRGYWKEQGVYEDCVGAAHYFIGQFETNWPQHIQSILHVVDPQI